MIKQLKKDIKKYGLKVVVIGNIIKIFLFLLFNYFNILLLIDILKKM